ncbi:MAG: hypothetical protein ABI778_10470, partial [Ignavibacteriota bacterium]
GDSIVLESQRISDGGFSRVKYRQVFSKNGKLLKEVSTSAGEIHDLRYFNAEGSWVHYSQLLASRRNNWQYTMALKERTIYDSLGRPTEEDQYDPYAAAKDSGKILLKKVYQYSKKGDEIIISDYKLLLYQTPQFYELEEEEIRRINSVERTIHIDSKRYPTPTGYVQVSRSVKEYDSDWRILVENTGITYPHGESVTKKIIYKRTSDGHLISKTTSDGNSQDYYTESWEYDDSGNCISQSWGGTISDSWRYDNKGNLVEYRYRNGSRNRFIISYK